MVYSVTLGFLLAPTCPVSPSCVVGITTRLVVGRSGPGAPGAARYFLQNIKTASGAHLASCSVGIGDFFSWSEAAWRVNNHYLRPVQRLRVGARILLLLLYVVVE
jgi:hypothetical protein